jgi:hypothetical protein
MPRIPGTNNAQTIFLRAFHNNPTGPEPKDWPTPAILRRWLRRPTFRRALQSVQDTLRFQADFHIANAATKAAKHFETQDSALTTQDLAKLLRLSHVRQRFTSSAPLDDQHTNGDDTAAADIPPDDPDVIDLRNLKPYWKTPDQYVSSDLLAIAKITPKALELGFLPPLYAHPDFPAPTPQDSYYYNLLHNPDALCCYIRAYSERFPDDDRYKRLIEKINPCIPHPNPRYPQFADLPDKRWRSPATLPAPTPRETRPANNPDHSDHSSDSSSAPPAPAPPATPATRLY